MGIIDKLRGTSSKSAGSVDDSAKRAEAVEKLLYSLNTFSKNYGLLWTKYKKNDELDCYIISAEQITAVATNVPSLVNACKDVGINNEIKELGGKETAGDKPKMSLQLCDERLCVIIPSQVPLSDILKTSKKATRYGGVIFSLENGLEKIYGR